MTKVLVTGASGFIGQHLVEALTARGDDVLCLMRSTSKNIDELKRRGCHLVYGDVTDAESLPAAVAGAEVVYHLAGITKALKRQEFLAVNVQGVRNVMRACAERQSPPTVVLVSSLAAAGPSTPTRPREEGDPIRPVSNYGRSKRAGELAGMEWAARVPLTIVRPPIVYGAGDVTGTFGFFGAIAKLRIHPVPGTGRARFSLVHARDLAHALIAAAERGHRIDRASNGHRVGGIYFVAGEEQPSYLELGRLIADALECKWFTVWPWHDELVLLPVGLAAELIGRLRGQPLSLNLDKVREAQAGSWTCSSQALRDDAGFSQSVPLREGLRETADWYRRGGWL